MTIVNNKYDFTNCLKNQFIYPIPLCESKLIFFAPHGAGVDEKNQWAFMYDSRHSLYFKPLDSFLTGQKDRGCIRLLKKII